MKTSKTNSYYGWYVVAAGFIILFCFAGSGFYSFGVFIKPLENEFGWSRSAIALTISIYLLVNGCVSPFIGRLVQSIGAKKVMLFGASGAGLCFVLISFIQDILYLYILYALLAVHLVAMGYIPVSTVIAGWFERNRGTAIGLAYMGLSAGGFVYAPLIGHINVNYGWRISFVFLGILIWVVAIPLSIFIIREKTDDSEPVFPEKIPFGKRTKDSLAFKDALLTSSFWGIVITFFLGAMAQMAVLQHQVAIMAEKEISYGLAAAALGLTSGMGGIGKFCFGKMADLFPIRWVVTSSYLLQCLGIFILLNVGSNLTIWIYAMIFGFGMGGILVLQPLAVGQFFGLKSFSVLLGIISLGQSCGAAIGAYSAGLIYDHYHQYHPALITFLIIYSLAMTSILITGKPMMKRCLND
ncbi:MFS transporter [Desulfosarcina widdelii]|nr:MFS transporter [Desulfosarcina widdelii]